MNQDKKGRAFWHDYKAKCIYFITMKKAPASSYSLPASSNSPHVASSDLPSLSSPGNFACARTPPNGSHYYFGPEFASFGKIIGDPAIPHGTPGCAGINLTTLGKIVRNAIYNISLLEPKARLFQYAIMPDHIHFLLSIEQTLDQPLGVLIARLKNAINRKAGLTGIFQEGFNDQILRWDRNLNDIFNYIRDNPRRLAMRMANPEYFRRKTRTLLAGHTCMLYGNLDLLRNPFKQQVIVHRADTDSDFIRNRNQCLYTASNGGVLVSPFIARREHDIFNEAEAAGGRFIKISPTPLGDREKPTGRDFRLCGVGRLLIVSPLNLQDIEMLDSNRKVTRRQALLMNQLAEDICANKLY